MKKVTSQILAGLLLFGQLGSVVTYAQETTWAVAVSQRDDQLGQDFLGIDMSQPWLEILRSLGGHSLEEVVAQAQRLDLTTVGPVYQAMLETSLEAIKSQETLDPMADGRDVYNDSFILSRLVDELSLEEQVALNIIRTVDFYRLQGLYGQEKDIQTILLESIEYFYDQQNSELEQNLIYALAKRTGYAPEAFRFNLQETLSDTAAYYRIENTYQDNILWQADYWYDYASDSLEVLGEGMRERTVSDWIYDLVEKYGASISN